MSRASPIDVPGPAWQRSSQGWISLVTTATSSVVSRPAATSGVRARAVAPSQSEAATSTSMTIPLSISRVRTRFEACCCAASADGEPTVRVATTSRPPVNAA
jgi:hypothetical protein